MSEANKKLVCRWFDEVWNQQRESAIDEMFAPNGKAHGFPEPKPTLVGPGEFKEFYRNFLQAFPDIHFTVDETICEDNRVAVVWTATMTHRGDGLGFPATNQKETLVGCSVLVVDGTQIQDGTNYMELQGLLQRLKEAAPQATERAEPSLV